ncbi:MAG TPA: type II CAAX endopeptidase family protein [Prosthecobacter sp.]|nr:type II CAAX endopeptidase family protein [Prosthecobacter sp.]
MKHLSICVAQQLLALFFFSASLAAAESAPDVAAAREAAAQLMPKLQAGSWQSSEAALQTISQLATSKEKADKDLLEKLVGLCVAAVERGMKNLPAPPEQEQLFWAAESLTDSLLQNLTAFNVQNARAIVAAGEKAQPDHLGFRLLRLRLHVVDKKREEQIKLSAALMAEKDFSPNNRNYVREVHVCALLRGGPTLSEDFQRAEAVLTPWLKHEPRNLKVRLLHLELFQVRKDWQAQYALATELLVDEKLTNSDYKWVQHCRLESAFNTGKTQELNQQDWNFMLEQIIGGTGLMHLIKEHGQLLLGIAFGIGWLWLFIVAFITRCVRAKPPGFWMTMLWSTIPLYAGTVIVTPQIFCITFSLLGVVFLIFAITGPKTPLGYLVPPQAATESGEARWKRVLGWCVIAYLLIQAFAHIYAWTFERVMGRELESQLVAKLMRTDSLDGLFSIVLAGGIFVPLLEEVVFRGMLQDWVARRLPAGWCVLLVSSLFGLLHGIEMAIPIALFGVLLSLLRIRYRSLWPAIALHALNNSVLIIALYLDPTSAHL